MSRYFHPQKDFFDRIKMPVPEAIPHGTEEDIAEKLKPVKTSTWRLEGNKLITETDQGNLVNFIPTTHILVGTDDNNMPIFKKIA